MLGKKNPDVYLGENKVLEFKFCLETVSHSYFQATFALLEDFEIFDNFEHISTSLSTPEIGYDPIGPKIWIVNIQ